MPHACRAASSFTVRAARILPAWALLSAAEDLSMRMSSIQGKRLRSQQRNRCTAAAAFSVTANAVPFQFTGWFSAIRPTCRTGVQTGALAFHRIELPATFCPARIVAGCSVANQAAVRWREFDSAR